MDAGHGGHLTLEEIGMRAGVSRSTVSRVLNDHPNVRSEVRAKVEAVIAETGYQPNPAARALVSRRSGLIGLVMLTHVDELFVDPYYAALIDGIQQGCAQHDLIFAIFPTGADALTPQLTSRFIDGLIVTSTPRSDPLIAALRHRGTPMVVIGHPPDPSGLTRVDVDNQHGSERIVGHLLGLGRRRIGFVGPTAEHQYGVDRFAGYRAALERAAVPLDDALVRRDEPTADGGYRAAAALFAEVVPDAVFAATDTLGVGVYRAATARGLSIPADVAIVGFDGLPRAPRLDPALTTMVQPMGEVGCTAVGLLTDENAHPRTVILPTEMRVGGSCGAEPQAPAESPPAPAGR